MLLIGSLAARYHFNDFRQARHDIDLIALPKETDALGLPEKQDKHAGKRSFKLGDKLIEVELATPGNTAYELYPNSHGSTFIEGIGKVDVASPGVLYLLKRSHVVFSHAWEKTFRDHRFFQARTSIPSHLQPVLEARLQETRKRFREHSFDMTNDEFFAKSAHAVRRFMPHDEIHEAIKFGGVPLFKLLKDDPNNATVSYSKFEALSFEQKIRNMQEELMVLTTERFVLPAVKDGLPYSEKYGANQIMKSLCHNYLPFEFRMFAVDNFYLILNGLPWGFSDKVIQRMRVN